MRRVERLQVRSLGSKFVLAALLVALMGYFFDLECMINQCESVSSVSHGECVSPVVIPDPHPPAQIVAEFSIVPVLLDLAVASQPSREVAEAARTFWPLRPPEHLLFATANARRGPPVRA